VRDASGVARLVDDLFRRSAGEITAVLVRRTGGLHLDAAEEAVQEAFVQAWRRWPWSGVPANPRGWLFRVASRRALDTLRTRERRTGLLEDAAREAGATEAGVEGGDLVGVGLGGPPAGLPDPERVADDELALLLLCADPTLPRITRVMLTLKLGCGFSVDEIAAAFLMKPTTVAQRCVRAKRTLREAGVRPPEPTMTLLRERAPVLREVLYLLFTGGHAAAEGEGPVRADLCGEAIRLGRLMLRAPGGDTPPTRALLALCCLHGARLPARSGPRGLPRSLEEQDRSLWDRGLLAEGFHHLEESARGSSVTRYHLEAGIAAVHAGAASWSETDWRRVVELYDELAARSPSAVLELNRAIALAELRGPEAALPAVEALAEEPSLAAYHLVPATLGALNRRLGREDLASGYYREAAARAPSAAERRYFEAQVAALGGG